MIEYCTGNILESTADALVNPVNCVGTMGNGLAFQFKKAFPANYAEYVKDCKARRLSPGMVVWAKEHGKYIANMAVKNHWRNPSRYSWVETGLRVLAETCLIVPIKITSIAIPALGCGHGGLEWAKVRQMIEYAFKGLSILAMVYEPQE